MACDTAVNPLRDVSSGLCVYVLQCAAGTFGLSNPIGEDQEETYLLSGDSRVESGGNFGAVPMV